jgi:nucleotide-binding universal stress UspA family protein
MAGEQNVITAADEAMPRIVAGVHGTAASDAALDWAAREARLRRARLHLVLALDPAVSRRAPYAQPADPAGGEADAVWLAEAAGRAARLLPPDRVSTELADGLPARVLADRAAGASLLVLGAAPSGFLGPVARACLLQSPCPVVIVALGSSCAAAVPRARGGAGDVRPRAVASR